MKISIYIVKSRLNSAGKVAIKCRITYNKQRKDFSTGLFINPDYWKSNQIQIIMKIKNSSAFFSKRFNIFIVIVIISNLHFVKAQEEFDCEYTPVPLVELSSANFNELQLGPDDGRPYVINIH